MGLGPSLVAAGGSLLGGLLGKPKEYDAKENSARAIIGQAGGARRAARKFGFNPLTLLGVSSAVAPSTGAPNLMGSAIADAAAYLADGMSESASQKAKIDAQSAEIESLRKEVITKTIRPMTPGVYQQGAGGPLRPASVEAPSLTTIRTGQVVDTAALLKLADDYAETGPEFTEAPSDVMKAPPVVPYMWGGQYFRPHPDYPDASLVEEYMGDEGPGATVMNWEQGMDKLVYHYGQTPWGMRFKSWARGDYEKIDADTKRRDTFRNMNNRDIGFDPNHRDGYYVK